MYLNLLEEKSKKIFLKLVCQLVAADGNYSSEEKMMIAEYCREMQIDFVQEEMKESIHDIIANINSSCDVKEKRIIIFEAIGLAMIDNCYDIREKKIVDKMTDVFELKKEFCDKCETLVNEYISLQKKIGELVIS